MKLSSCLLLPSTTVALALACTTIHAVEPAHVTRLRADSVTFKSKDGKGRDRTFERDTFPGTWTIVDRSPDGTKLYVRNDGKDYVVDAVDVATDETRTSRACLDKAAPKPGATRGFDGCKP